MRSIYSGKETVGEYWERTRSKRATILAGVLLIFVFSLIVFNQGEKANAEEVFETGNVPDTKTSDELLSENTSDQVEQYQCSLPEVYPYQEHQSNWENLLTHCKIIEEVTDKYQGIDPELVAAIIMVESDGDFKKLSKVGAVGLMQVMPSDGYSGDTWGFNDRPITYDLFNPETNVREGVRILHDAINTWGDLWNGLYHYVGLDPNYPNKVIDIYEYLKNN